MIRIAGLRVPLGYDEEFLHQRAAERLGITRGRILSLVINSRTIDTSEKDDIAYLMTLYIHVSGSENELVWSIKDKKITLGTESVYIVPASKPAPLRPVVIGFGPAGMFAALILAESGARPIVLERGSDVDSRRKSVSAFWETGVLDTGTNVQFGAGGAGTFSDGKLKTGKKDARKMKILEELIEAGAPPEILYDSKPHIGTDRLHGAVKSIAAKIVRLGGDIHYNTRVTQLIRRGGQLTGVGYIENGIYTECSAGHAILAIGHSARDTFAYLESSGIRMEQKPFAVGVRVEHPQSLINELQYGRFARDSRLGAADYKMVVHLPDGRAVYTFCMCPGGSVVAAASEEGGLVTNGMSRWKRDGVNANTAILVTVDGKDLQSDHPLAGTVFQRGLEQLAFAAGGGSYSAPVQRLEDFMKDRPSKFFGDVRPTYMPGTNFSPVETYLPAGIAGALRCGFAEMGEWMPGYMYPDAVITGAETRSTSPVRILRTESLEAVGVSGLYPCGEGAGYAGGIISAAVDGVLCAEKICDKNQSYMI